LSIHIGAARGDVAETVLLPGDPLRAKMIAETFLENPVRYNEVRGMFGYTGTYQGKRVSVQGTGMGIPSISIYVNELISEFGVKKLVRIGTCGALQEKIGIRDVILGMGACTDSNVNNVRFKGMNYSPTASFNLLSKAVKAAEEINIRPHVGNIITSDAFYQDDPNGWKLWASYNVLAVEMETAELYTLAAKHGVEALAILTVSDHIVTHELTSAEERQNTFRQMIEIALSLAE